MSTNTIARFLLCLFIAQVTQAQTIVHGTSVTGLQFDNGTVKITILNTSEHNVTGFTVGVTCKLADGTGQLQTTTEDYGPAALTNRSLRTGESVEETASCGARATSATAEVLTAFYDDQTAEVKDQRSFDDTIAVRQGIAHAYQLAASALKKSESDAAPKQRAQRELQSALNDANAGKSDANKTFLQGELDAVKGAPLGHEQEFIQERAQRVQQRATLFTQHADVRRLP